MVARYDGKLPATASHKRLVLDRLWQEDLETWWDYVLLPALLPAEL